MNISMLADSNPKLERNTSHPSTDSFKEGMKRNKSVLQLMEKIPDEAESLTVLVGGVQFLKEHVVAFVRLEQVQV